MFKGGTHCAEWVSPWIQPLQTLHPSSFLTGSGGSPGRCHPPLMPLGAARGQTRGEVCKNLSSEGLFLTGLCHWDTRTLLQSSSGSPHAPPRLCPGKEKKNEKKKPQATSFQSNSQQAVPHRIKSCRSAPSSLGSSSLREKQPREKPAQVGREGCAQEGPDPGSVVHTGGAGREVGVAK